MPSATASAPSISTAGFTILPNSILLDPSLSIEAKSTLGLLRFFDRGYGKGCFCKKETLCHYLRLSPYRLRKALDELVKLGLITIQRRGQGQTDVIFVAYEEERETPGPQPLQFEDFEDEIEEEPVHVGEELDEVDRCEPGEKCADLEVKPVEIQTCNDFTHKEQSVQENLDKNHTTTQPESIKPPSNATKDKCEELIIFFYATKEHRQPTRNELKNWASTARRLLSEFTLPELKEATKYAIDQGARLFYFVALTGPDFILKRRQQREAEINREREAERGREQEEAKRRKFEELRKSSATYEKLTQDLLGNLSQRLRPQSVNVWFKDTFVIEATNDSLTLAVGSSYIADFISEKYKALLQEITGKSDIQFITG